MTEDEMRDALINAWYEGEDERFGQLIAQGGAEYMLLRDECDVSAFTWILDMGVKGYPDVDETDYPCMQAVAAPGIRDQDGFHALHLATFMGHLDLVRTLIGFGAPPDVESTSGITPLDIATSIGYKHIAGYLENFPHRQPRQLERRGYTLSEAAENADIPKIKELLDAGVNANADEWGICLFWRNEYTPLQQVARAKVSDEQAVEAAKLLIAAGATVNRYELDDWTALHEAVSHGKPELMRLLLEAGADMERMTAERWRPVEIAMRYLEGETRIECIKVALEFGADINFVDDDGRTPLDIAQKWDPALAELISAHGGKTAEEL